jgi:choline transporter-like protein 2/4/5
MYIANCFIFWLQRYIADIGKSWPVFIVCGGILPVFLSVIWLLMIRYFVAAMTWITVVLFNALVISVTMFCYIKGTVHYLVPSY